MNPEIQLIWNEIVGDLTTPVVIWQLLAVATCLIGAWTINALIKRVFMPNASQDTQIVFGGIKRVIFPITAFLLVNMTKVILDDWMHVGIIRLTAKLLLAMALIRLIIYGLRTIFAPGGWLKSVEHLISWVIWLVLALHLSGFLTQFLDVLRDIQFPLGSTQVNVLMVFQGILTIILALFIGMWLSRLIEKRLMAQAHVSMNMRVVMVKLVRIIFIVIATLIGLSAVGLDITLLSVFGGALGVGLGFGLQKIASNYVSGFIILLDHSMKIGDLLTIENHYGVVTDLKSRYTVLRKLDGTQVVIPNETMITNSVINHSYTDKNVRIQLPVQVSYETDLSEVLNILLTLLIEHPRSLKDPAPAVNIAGFADSGIDLMMSVWIGDPEQGTAQMQTEIYLAMWRAFKSHGITIPFPQREVRLL